MSQFFLHSTARASRQGAARLRSPAVSSGARAVTLVEMLVAVAITIAMLVASSLIFKAASEAAGKAKANNELIMQARTLTQQLEKDFQGLRPDLPMAVIFEIVEVPDLDPDSATGLKTVRQDRIVFFANGDYTIAGRPDQQVYSGYGPAVNSNLGRITYTQNYDAKNISPEYGDGRYILSRVYKLLTVDTGTSWSGGSPDASLVWSHVPYYEWYLNSLVELTTADWWKNHVHSALPNITYYLHGGLSSCWLTRPNISNILHLDDPGYPPLPSGYNRNNYDPHDALQRFYMLPDVSEFKVELWFENSIEWYPWPNKYPPLDYSYGFYWNTNDIAPGAGARTPVSLSYNDNGVTRTTWWYGAWGDPATADFMYLDGVRTLNDFWPNFWPQAVRVTFTLHDKNRKYYPEGLTFEYILKVPQP